MCAAHSHRRLTRSVQTKAVLDAKPRSETIENLSKSWKIKMLYDGECPLCMREVSHLFCSLLPNYVLIVVVNAE